MAASQWKAAARSSILLTLLIHTSRTLFDFRRDVVVDGNGGIDPTSVYVPGAGFSGFWFTLGRLQALQDPQQRNYYCFSAGCLGVVATLTNFSVNDVTDLAFDLQGQWKMGNLTRFELAELFADGLLSPRSFSNTSSLSTDSDVLDVDILNKINVITTKRGKGVDIRRAKNAEELKEMLIQTTWIPFATGWGFWRSDIDGGSYMDGGLLMPFHPKCHLELGLPPMMDLFLNIINPDLSRQQVRKFLTAGINY